MTRTRATVACALAVASVTLLAGCTTPTPEPSSSASAPESQEPTSTPTPDPEPVFDGTAEQNQDYFDFVNRELIDSGVTLNGAAFIDNLEAKGYQRAAMEVTPDETAIGIPADNIVFSIRFTDSCLLGQWGNIGYTSMVTEIPSTGRCIIGTPRPA